jgi:N-acetylneuraminic acid mutarotase
LIGAVGPPVGEARRAATRGGARLAGLAILVVGATWAMATAPVTHGGVAAAPAAQLGNWLVLATMLAPQREGWADVLDGRIYFVGGFADLGLGTGASTLVQAYDIAADRWSEVTPLPEPLHHPMAATVDGALYVVGGFAGSFGQRAPVDSVWAYDPVADRWARRASLPAPVGAGAVAVLDGRLYVLGGERRRPSGGPGDYESVADVSVYDPRTDRWEVLPPMRYRRDHLVAGAINGRVYAAGGRDRPILDLPVVEEYDPATRTWRERAPIPTGRSGSAGAVLGDKLYVFGGEGNPASPRGVFAEVEVYDPATDTWTQVDVMPTPRHGLGAVTVGQRIYLPGGSTRQGGLGPGGTAILDAYEPD